MTIFALFSQQRSGAGALSSFISEHRGVRNLNEVLNPASIEQEDNFFAYWLAHDPAEMIRSRRSPSDLFITYLDGLQLKYPGEQLLLDIKLNSIRHVLNYWEEMAGFEQVKMPWLLNLFHRRSTPIIYLHRENHFRRFVSSRLAEMSGIYRSNIPGSVGNVRFEADLEDMKAYIRKGEESHGLFMECMAKFDKHLYLTYEQCFLGSKIKPETKMDIARFFGFELRVDAEPYYVKQGSGKLDKVVINYKAAHAELSRINQGHYVEG